MPKKDKKQKKSFDGLFDGVNEKRNANRKAMKDSREKDKKERIKKAEIEAMRQEKKEDKKKFLGDLKKIITDAFLTNKINFPKIQEIKGNISVTNFSELNKKFDSLIENVIKLKPKEKEEIDYSENFSLLLQEIKNGNIGNKQLAKILQNISKSSDNKVLLEKLSILDNIKIDPHGRIKVNVDKVGGGGGGAGSEYVKNSDGEYIDPATNDALGGGTLNKKIEDLGEDIAAAVYSVVTAHDKRYSFEGLYLNFSTAQSKNIELYLINGTKEILLWYKYDDVNLSRVFVPDRIWKFPADWELKLKISQTSGACSANILLLTNS